MTQALVPPARTDAVLARLTTLHPKLIDLSLDRLQRLLARLGNPERQLSPVIHVAGTNGKGSLIAYLRAILEAAGYRVNVYTSPHLVRFNERIRVAGEMIRDEPLVALLEEIERANGDQPITFFEATTAAAFLAFSRATADIVLLETGLGGRLDATNVVDQPLLTAITPVAFDHMEFLGRTLSAIAGEKAGILKPGAPAVIGPQADEAANAIAARAAKLGVTLYRFGEDFSASESEGRLRWQSQGKTLDLPRPALAGPHQIVNAGTAIACIRSLRGFKVGDAALAAGLTQVEWPARLQRLTRGPLQARLPEGAELWLDGVHNPHCAEAIAAALAEWRAHDPAARPHHLIFGAKSNKDLSGILRPLARVADEVYGVAIPGDANCFQPAEIVTVARGLGLAAEPALSVADALTSIRRGNAAGAPPPRILICGSLYLAGTVLAENG